MSVPPTEEGGFREPPRRSRAGGTGRGVFREKGYGFIFTDDGQEVLVLRIPRGFSATEATFKEGEAVNLELKESERGPGEVPVGRFSE